MLELGKKQTLKVLRMKEIGAYVGEDEADAGILLPKKERICFSTPGNPFQTLKEIIPAKLPVRDADAWYFRSIASFAHRPLLVKATLSKHKSNHS